MGRRAPLRGSPAGPRAAPGPVGGGSLPAGEAVPRGTGRPHRAPDTSPGPCRMAGEEGSSRTLSGSVLAGQDTGSSLSARTASQPGRGGAQFSPPAAICPSLQSSTARGPVAKGESCPSGAGSPVGVGSFPRRPTSSPLPPAARALLTCVGLAGADQLLQQLGGDPLARLVVPGHALQGPLLPHPVLQHLGGGLHEVSLHVGPAEHGEVGLRGGRGSGRDRRPLRKGAPCPPLLPRGRGTLPSGSRLTWEHSWCMTWPNSWK